MDVVFPHIPIGDWNRSQVVDDMIVSCAQAIGASPTDVYPVCTCGNVCICVDLYIRPDPTRVSSIDILTYILTLMVCVHVDDELHYQWS